MNFKHISSLLDAPPCPRIRYPPTLLSPQNSPAFTIEGEDFELESHSLELLYENGNSFCSEEEPGTSAPEAPYFPELMEDE
jgi:hypothetical protein